MTQKFINTPKDISYRRPNLRNLHRTIFTPVISTPPIKVQQPTQAQRLNPQLTDNFHNSMGRHYQHQFAGQSANTHVSVLKKPKISFSQWLLNTILILAMFAITGLLIDFLLNIVNALVGIHSENIWLFFPIFSFLGLVLGAFFGTKALDVLFGIFYNTSNANNPSNVDSSFSSGALKAIGFGLFLAIIGWLGTMVFA